MSKSAVDANLLHDRLEQELRAAAAQPGETPANPPPAAPAAPAPAPPPGRLARLAGRIGRMLAYHSGVEAEIARLQDRVQELGALHEQAQHTAEMREQGLDRLRRQISRMAGELSFAHRRLARLAAQEDGMKLPSPAAAAPERADAEIVGRVIAGFEERMRAPREEIKKRLATHLPRMRMAGAIGGGRPLLDLGCGRGEWLELLAEAGLEAYGVERDAQLVDLCRSLGLAVRQGEALEHLASLPDDSLGAISAFHLIEHLETAGLLGVIDQARRTLARGGLLLLEAPNRENYRVSMGTFDRASHAIAPEFARYLVEISGFTDVEILRLNPFPEQLRIREQSEVAGQVNDLLYGPRDLAIIARKA